MIVYIVGIQKLKFAYKVARLNGESPHIKIQKLN